MAECTVCEGLGNYPIMNKFGSHLYSISCPECWGSGDDDGADEERRAENALRQRDAEIEGKYRQAMAEKAGLL